MRKSLCEGLRFGVDPPMKGHSDEVNCVAVSPDNQWIASGSDDKTMRVWSVGGLMEVHKMKCGEFVLSVAWTPDNKYVVCGAGDYRGAHGEVEVWRVRDQHRERVMKGHTQKVVSVCVSSDGRLVASGSDDKTAKVWEVESGTDLKTFTGHSVEVTCVGIRDGHLLVTGSGDHTIRLWEVGSGETIRVLEGHTNEVTSLSFNNTFELIASGSADKTIKVWEVTQGVCDMRAIFTRIRRCGIVWV